MSTMLTSAELDKLEAIAKRAVTKVQQRDRASISGLLGEFGKVRAHLELFNKPEGTKQLLAALIRDGAFTRSGQTEDYLKQIQGMLQEIQRSFGAEKVYAALCWIRRMLIVQDKLSTRLRPSSRQRR